MTRRTSPTTTTASSSSPTTPTKASTSSGRRSTGSSSTVELTAIVNPRAGRGACGRRAPAFLESLRGRDVSVNVFETSAPGDATQLARAAWVAGSRHFLVAGGDGTVCEVLNGLLPGVRESGAGSPVLGIAPLGTGNSSARHFGIAADESGRLLAAIERDERVRADVLRLSHAGGEILVLGTICIGFPAVVAALVNRRLKRFGMLGYTLGVLLELWRLRTVAVDLELEDSHGAKRSVRGERFFLAIQNVEWVGGNMRMAPGAATDDGLAELVDVRPISRLEALRVFPRIFDGSHAAHPAVSFEPFTKVRFNDPQPAEVMYDGEVRELTVHTIEVLPAELEVWSPKSS